MWKPCIELNIIVVAINGSLVTLLLSEVAQADYGQTLAHYTV